MPDSPISVKWLNDREKAIAVQRVADHQLGVKNSTYSPLGTALTTLLTQLSTTDHLKWGQVSHYYYAGPFMPFSNIKTSS
jgi:hypothetical protein